MWTATILANCLISASNVDFGSNGILTTAVDANGALSVRCTNTTPYVIALSLGTGGGTTAVTRKMVNGAASVSYGLYQDVARALPFGPLTGETLSGTGTGLAQSVAVFGRVPPQTTPAPGTYSDTITATVTF